jgi:hypothetical protein
MAEFYAVEDLFWGEDIVVLMRRHPTTTSARIVRSNQPP